MDPHENYRHYQYYQRLLEERRLKQRLIAAYTRVRNHAQAETAEEPTVLLEYISPSRSSRLAAFTRKHKGAFLGAAVVAATAALRSETIRRKRSSKR